MKGLIRGGRSLRLPREAGAGTRGDSTREVSHDPPIHTSHHHPGIEVGLHYSWFIIFFLITVSLTTR